MKRFRKESKNFPKAGEMPIMGAMLEFGPFRLDTEAGILYRGSEPVALGRRAVALLSVLVERAGTPVSKETLIEAAWPDLAVEDSNLTVQIAALRRVFAQEPGGERWIKTLSRRGYRFVGPLAAPDTENEPLVGGLAEVGPLPDKPSIAVLAFENLSGDPEQDYFADGLADEIITGLSKCSWFFVIARNSSFTYKGKAVAAKQVASELGVQYLVQGSVRKAGDRVRIIAQLVDALTGRHLWAERYDRHLEDVFAVQDDLTEAIVSAVAPSFVSAEARRVERKPRENFDAWDYAMRGNWHLWRRSKTGFSEARRMFEKALAIDPRSTKALAGLAEMLGMSITFGWAEDPDQARTTGHAAAQRAVEIDESDAEAHLALAHINFHMQDLDAAAAACRRAVEINPNLARAEGMLGNILSWRGIDGDYEEAILHADRAARLSPRDSTSSLWGLARTSAAFAAGQYDRAIEWARIQIAATPDFPGAHRYLAASLALLGRLEEARAAKDQLLRVLPDENLRLVRAGLPSVNAERMERFVDGLRKAGVPE